MIEQFFANEGLVPITTTAKQDFYTINEWYDNHTVIYTVGEKGTTSLYLHNIITGKKDLFYQTEEFISKVQANSNYSLFAIQTFEQSGVTHIRIINKIGREVFSWSDKIDELQFMWNPYESNEMVVAEFLANLDFQLLKIRVDTKKVEKIPVTNPFVQWISKDEIGYLNWNQNEPSIEAPLLLFNMNTNTEEKWLTNCIIFFSLKDIMMTVSIDENDLYQSLYTFYDSKTRKKLTALHIPVLNTFSEAWWIPSFDYDEENKLFYYMKPKRAGDISEYNEGYQLTVLSLANNKEKVLETFSDNLPIKLSPDGQWCLIGPQFEQVLNASSRKITRLVSN
ncbi:MAG TPA: hypothetical protein GX497_07335 [Bacillus bacterium]|nr:hypothetical protein [Bacillus sp. (in: firmicutes)]